VGKKRKEDEGKDELRMILEPSESRRHSKLLDLLLEYGVLGDVSLLFQNRNGRIVSSNEKKEGEAGVRERK